MDKVSYALGLGIGQQLKSMGAQDLCIDDFAQAIKDVLENKELAVSHHEAQSIVTQYFQEKEAAMNKEKEAKGKQAKADGEKFLKENAQKERSHDCLRTTIHDIGRRRRQKPQSDRQGALPL